jgi:hypothetical protein
LNAEADIPVEDLLRLYHPELYSDSPEKPKPEKIRKKRSKEKPEKGSSDEAEDSKSKAEENDDQVRLMQRLRVKNICPYDDCHI